jgi:hypothetical protein
MMTIATPMIVDATTIVAIVVAAVRQMHDDVRADLLDVGKVSARPLARGCGYPDIGR